MWNNLICDSVHVLFCYQLYSFCFELSKTHTVIATAKVNLYHIYEINGWRNINFILAHDPMWFKQWNQNKVSITGESHCEYLCTILFVSEWTHKLWMSFSKLFMCIVCVCIFAIILFIILFLTTSVSKKVSENKIEGKKWNR